MGLFAKTIFSAILRALQRAVSDPQHYAQHLTRPSPPVASSFTSDTNHQTPPLPKPQTQPRDIRRKPNKGADLACKFSSFGPAFASDPVWEGSIQSSDGLPE